MRLTVSSLDSKEALTNIDKVYMDYVTSNLHASMCEKNIESLQRVERSV